MEPGDRGSELQARPEDEDHVEQPFRLEDDSESAPLIKGGGGGSYHTHPIGAGGGGGDGDVEKMPTIHASFAFIKCSWGIGFLATPYAVSKAGWLGALIGFLVIGLIVSYTAKLLIRAKMELKSNGIEVKTLVDIARTCFGQPAVYATVILLFVTQLGVCILYTIFASRSLASIVKPHDSAGFWYGVMVLCLFPIFCLSSQVRSLPLLAKVSLVTSTLMAISSIIIIVYGMSHGKQCVNPLSGFPEDCHVDVFNFDTFPVFVGVVTFAMEGIGSVMPIHEAMANPEDFMMMANVAMGFLCCLYASFGIAAYQLYSSMTQSVIALNVEGAEGDAVKIMLALVLVGTYPLQLFPLSRTIDDMTGWDQDPSASRKAHLARLGLVFFTAMVAIAVPYFGNVLSLAGAVCFSLLGFFFPVFSYLKIMGSSAPGVDKAMCAITTVLAIFIFLAGVVVNVEELADHPLN